MIILHSRYSQYYYEMKYFPKAFGCLLISGSIVYLSRRQQQQHQQMLYLHDHK